jgi:hypothetical protein
VDGGIDRGQKVEAEQGQVGQVVVGEGFSPEVGMDEPEASQKPPAQRELLQFGDEEAALIPDDDVFNRAQPADEQADLTVDLKGCFDQGPSKVSGQDLADRNAATVEAFK